MGNLGSSFLNCGVVRALTGDEDVDLTFSGVYTTREAERRLHHEREQRICDEIQKREQRLADLEADARDLELEAVRYKRNAERFPKTAREYQLSLGNARRSLLAAQKKRGLMGKERKLVDIANAAVERMRVVDSGGDDSKFISELREFTQAVDLGEHTMAMNQTRQDASQVLNDAAGLLNLQEEMVDGIADLEDPNASGTVVFGDQTLSLRDDSDLLTALSHLEAEQEPRATSGGAAAMAAQQETRRKSRRSKSGARRPLAQMNVLGDDDLGMPPAPSSEPMRSSYDRAALAVKTDGAVRARDNARSNFDDDDDGEDPFANVF